MTSSSTRVFALSGRRRRHPPVLFGPNSRRQTEQPRLFRRSRLTVQQESRSPARSARRFSASFQADFAADGRLHPTLSTGARGRGWFDIYRGTLDGESELIVQSELGLAARFDLAGRQILRSSPRPWARMPDNLLSARPCDEENDHDFQAAGRGSRGRIRWADSNGGPIQEVSSFSTNVGREFGSVAFYDLTKGSFEIIRPSAHDAENLELCGTARKPGFWYSGP